MELSGVIVEFQVLGVGKLLAGFDIAAHKLFNCEEVREDGLGVDGQQA